MLGYFCLDAGKTGDLSCGETVFGLGRGQKYEKNTKDKYWMDMK